MKVKKFKKGFTLVELIVVIAVIAILAAVLIPTYTNLVHKANVSADSQLVRNLNERMALYEAETGKKPETAHEAFVLTEDFGFIIEKLTPTSSGNDIVWDMTTNRFALIDATDHTKVVYSDPTKTLSTNPIDLWKVSKTVPTSSKYSVYLAGTSIETAIPSLGVGVDVGRNTGVPSIAYTNLNASKGTKIVFRTDSGFTKLVINAPNDDVALFGHVGDVDVQAVKKGTLDIHGRVGGVLTLVYGKINVSSQGVVGVIVANPANSSDVEMSAQPGASVGTIISYDVTLVNTLASSVSVAVPQVKTEVVSKEDMETVLTSVAYIKGTTNRYFDSIQAAINAANGTTNIVLMKDFLFDNVTGPALSVPNGADIVLDLNGKIIQGYLNNTSSSTLITLGGASNTLETKLTIKDSTAPANGIGSGMLYVLNRYASDPMDVATSVIEINPKATVTIESGKLVNDAIVGNPGGGYGMYAVDVRTNGGESRDSKLIVKGGLLQSTNYRAVRAFANAQNSTIHLTIEGGKVYSPNNNAIWLQNDMHSYPDPVILTITGGVIESAGYINGVDRTPLNIGSEDGLTKTITGGTFIQNGLNVSSTYIVS